MTSLYETALNGLGLGTKLEDLDKMIANHAGDAMAHALLLGVGMAMTELESNERQARQAASSLQDAVARFNGNPTLSNAEWMSSYASKVEQYSRQAQAAYTTVGAQWRLWTMYSAKH